MPTHLLANRRKHESEHGERDEARATREPELIGRLAKPQGKEDRQADDGKRYGHREPRVEGSYSPQGEQPVPEIVLERSAPRGQDQEQSRPDRTENTRKALAGIDRVLSRWLWGSAARRQPV